MKNKYNKTITILVVLTIVFTIFGTTLAVWNWQTALEQRTLVTFTATSGFSCSGDGGGGYYYYNYSASGGSGIVIIRNKRS